MAVEESKNQCKCGGACDSCKSAVSDSLTEPEIKRLNNPDEEVEPGSALAVEAKSDEKVVEEVGGTEAETGATDAGPEGEILAPLPSYLAVLPVECLQLHVELPIHDHGDDSNDDDLPPETFDVDKKLFSVWLSSGNYFIIDGHHHFQKAKTATRFVTSKAQKDRLVATEAKVIARCYDESAGWTLPLVKDLSYKMNFEGKKAVTTEIYPFGPGEPIEDSLDAMIDSGQVFAFTDEVETECEAITDGLREGVLGVLRQKITRVNTPTKWGFTYVYPGPAGAAIDEANKRFKLRTMHTEKHHPQLVPEACDNNGCGPKFVSNFDNITGTPLSVALPDSDGWVVGSREIVDSPDGRLIWEAAKAGQPFPVSVRWLCDASARTTGKPKWLKLVTWDDVTSPAVVGAGAIADEAPPSSGDNMTSYAPEGKNGYGTPFQGINNNMVNPYPRDENDSAVEEIAQGDSAVGAKAQVQHMKTKTDLLKDIRAFRSLMKSGAKRQELQAADREAATGILDHYRAGEDVSDLVKTYQSAFADASPDSASYHSEVSGPWIELGNELGDDPLAGWGRDIARVPEAAAKGEDKNVQQKTETKAKPVGANGEHMGKGDEKEDEDGPDADEDRDRKMKKELDAKMDEFVLKGHPLGRLPGATQKLIRKAVRQSAKTVDEVAGILDSQVMLASGGQAADKLLNLGFTGMTQGRVINTLSPLASNLNEPQPGQGAFEKLMSATDDFLRMGNISPQLGAVNPDNADVKRLREHNKSKTARVVDECLEMFAGKIGKDKFWGAITDSHNDTDALEKQFKAIALADNYTTAVAQLPNQPTVLKWILTQGFQDQRFLQFADPIGPGFGTDGGDGWELQRGIGRVFKIFYESYNNPTGWGYQFNNVDFGLTTPENQGISEGSIQGYWDTFFPVWRKNATSDTIEAIKSIGNGPLNLSAIARSLWHCTARKSRAIDTAGMNEFPNIALEYGATQVTTETYTTANHGLPNQSVYPGSGTITVNLNPGKTASTTPTIGTDDYIQYPNPNVPTSGAGLAPIAAMRFLAGAPVGQNAAPYFGTNTFTKNPIVPPRGELTLTSAGADSTSVMNPIAISAPSSMVLGLLGNDGYIYSYPGTTATYAIDYPNGVVVFASGVTGAAGVLTTTVTFSTYSYSTNFDYFPITPGINGLASLATGEVPSEFYNRLLFQFDRTAATMKSGPRFMAPDLALMSANLSPVVTAATAFYKLNSPKETVLYPSEDYFATRDGINMARVNSPWMPGDNFIVLTRGGATKYAIDTPWNLQGPVVKYDSSGNLIAGEAYMGAENSCIFTPQVKDGSGNIINPVARIIMCLTGNTPI